MAFGRIASGLTGGLPAQQCRPKLGACLRFWGQLGIHNNSPGRPHDANDDLILHGTSFPRNLSLPTCRPPWKMDTHCSSANQIRARWRLCLTFRRYVPPRSFRVFLKVDSSCCRKCSTSCLVACTSSPCVCCVIGAKRHVWLLVIAPRVPKKSSLLHRQVVG